MRLVMVPAPSLALTRAVDGHNRQVLGREAWVAKYGMLVCATHVSCLQGWLLRACQLLIVGSERTYTSVHVHARARTS